MNRETSRRRPTTEQSSAGRSATMRAIRRTADGVIFDGSAPLPSPLEGEVRVRVQRVALSRMDVQVARGLFGFQGILGRAFAGVIDAVGDGVDRRRIGRRVIGRPVIACGSCDLCRAGLAAHCRTAVQPGCLGTDGALADYIVLPARGLVEIPDALDDDHAVFTPALASALQTARQIRIETKPYITVLGDGLIGLLCAQVLARLNASVRVVGRFTEKLNLCAKWGVKHRHVDDVGRRGDQDVVIECTGDPAGLELALRFVRPRGTIVVKSLIEPGARAALGGAVDLSRLVAAEVEVIGSFHGPITEALEVLQRREIDIASLISRRARLADGVAGLEHIARPETICIIVEV